MFIVIEKFPDWQSAAIATDENGYNKVFRTVEDAQVEADDCQDGIIVGDEVMDEDYHPLVEELHIIFSMLEEAAEEGDDTQTLERIKERVKKLLDQLKEEE